MIAYAGVQSISLLDIVQVRAWKKEKESSYLTWRDLDEVDLLFSLKITHC